MTFSDYLIDTVLVLLVVLQMHETRLTPRKVMLPLAVIAWAVVTYLHAIPTSGNNLVLIGALTGVGVALGAASGLTTRVRSDGGRHPLVKAGPAAAALWVFGMGSRFAFMVWAYNGGADTLGRFSRQHAISAASAWTAALILMALGEVIARTGVLVLRGRRSQAHDRTCAPKSLSHAI